MTSPSAPRFRSRVRLLLALVILAGLASTSFSMSKVVMNSDLRSASPQPRHLAIVARSWSGSPQSFVAAAQDLLRGGGLQAAGADILWFQQPGTAGAYYVAGAMSFTSTSSVEQIVALMKDVEARLNGGHPGQEGGTLLLELQWVEGVTASTPALTLPSPNILRKPWGLSAFVTSSEEPFGKSCAAGREPHAFCTQVAKDFQHLKTPQVYESGQDVWIGGEIEAGTLRIWGRAHGDEAETLAVAFDALLVADEAVQIAARATSAPTRSLVRSAASSVAARDADLAVPFTLKIPAGTPGARVSAWLEGLRKQFAVGTITPRRIAILGIRDGTVSGIIVGKKTSAASNRALVPVAAARVETTGAQPNEPSPVAIILELPLPALHRK